MAKWSFSKKHLPSEINGGNQYEIKDRLVLEQLNAITENSFYASEKVDTVISDAQDVVNQGKTEIENTTSQGKNELNSIVDDAEDLVAKANASINTVVGTANEALFTVQQVVASKGYYGSNPNLLINGDFRVNQREFEATNQTNTYTVDRWLLSTTDNLARVTLNTDKTINLKNTGTTSRGYFIQYIDPTLNNLWGRTLTMSCKFTDGFILSQTITMPSDKTTTGGTGASSTHNSINLRMFIYNQNKMGFTIDIQQGANTSIEWAKLEIGSVATAFSPRPYAEELAICQRYYLPLMNGASVYNGFIFTETNARISVPVPTTMRLRTPTAELKVDDITQCKIYSNGTQVTPTALVYAGFVDSDQFVINATIPNLTPNHTCAMRLLGSASLDAEIY